MAIFKRTETEVDAVLANKFPARPPAPLRPSAYPPSEKFILNCVCAVQDKPYQLIFVRQSLGRLRLMESLKLTGDARAGSADARPFAVQQTIPMTDLEGGPWFCAWCSDPGFHLCSCNAFVCGGRMQGKAFHCRQSCGAEWVGVLLREVQTTKEEKRPALTVPTTVPTPKAQTLPVARSAHMAAPNASRDLIIRKSTCTRDLRIETNSRIVRAAFKSPHVRLPSKTCGTGADAF